jgi:protease-4
MDRRAAWVLGIVFGGLFLCLFGFLFVFYAAVHGGEGRSSGGTGEKVGVVEVVGEITDGKQTLKQLREFRDDGSVKAIVVRVDSPGGAVGPSQEIYASIRKITAKKPVVVSMGSVAASGGFYIACAGTKVYADPGTLTGSIGVIMQAPNVTGLLKWAGVEMNTLTAGKMKDSLSPFREMRPDERQYFEALLEDVHEQFIGAVANGRNLKVEQVRPIADGRVFTGRKAKELKLVDELGGLSDAVAEAGKLAGIQGEPKVVYPEKEKKFLRELLDQDEARSLFRGAIEGAIDSLGGGLEFLSPVLSGH